MRVGVPCRSSATSATAKTMSSAVEQGLEAFGQIDIVGADAGISTYGSLWETSQEEWDEALGREPHGRLANAQSGRAVL